MDNLMTQFADANTSASHRLERVLKTVLAQDCKSTRDGRFRMTEQHKLAGFLEALYHDVLVKAIPPVIRLVTFMLKER